MIDIPVEVKDALREGSYRKNYKFTVYKVNVTTLYNDWMVFTANRPFELPIECSNDDCVVLHAPKVEEAVNLEGWVLWPSNARQRFYFAIGTEEDAYYEIRFGILPAGTKIYFSDAISGYDIGITCQSRIRYTSEEVEDFTIDNNNLVKESVSIDERMCSGDTLKFGLCEGSSLEFQYFGKENITGRQLQVFCDVSYEDAGTELTQNDSYTVSKAGNYEIVVPANTPRFDISYQPDGGLIETIRVYSSSSEQTVPLNNCGVGDVVSFSASSDISVTLRSEGGIAWCEIPMGYFTVKNCSRQASTGIIKVTAYNKLQSDYLDAKANELLQTVYSNGENVLLYDIQKSLLEDYQVKVDHSEIEPESGIGFDIAGFLLGGAPFYFTSLYGLETPLSAKQYNNYATPSTSTPFYIAFYATGLRYSIDTNVYWSFYKNYGDIEVFERNIYDRIRYIFDSAVLTTTSTTAPFTGGLVTGEMFCDYICKNLTGGFSSIFGAKVTQNNVTKIYSTIQWEYEEAHGITHTVAGTIKDFIEVTRQGDATVEIQLPETMEGKLQADFSSTSFSEMNFGQECYYEWWTNSQMVSYESFYVQPVKYADGTSYVVTHSNNNFDDAVTCGIEYLSRADAISLDPNNLPEFTLRDIITASYETVCQFGELDRETDLFRGVELNHSRLLPADTLYPANNLYPDGAQESAFRSQYSKLWADEGNIHKWRYLIITYKGLDEEQNEKDFTLQRTVNADGTDDYNMSDNWLFRNLVWTAEDVGTYADAMVAKMQDITWFPFEMWAAGLPYLETGDEIEIPLGEETYTSYILQRQLKGIQNLQDTYINGTLDIF